jgi:type IX secretion system PorP/SprF family membrane protein
MRKTYLSGILKFFILLFTTNVYAQNEPVFSQFYASSLYLNPALCGLEHKFAVTGIHRTQWAGINPYNTNSLSVILPFHSKNEEASHKGGMGANFFSAAAGDGGQYNMTGFSLSGAYNLHITATTPQNLTFGLQVGFVQINAFSNSNMNWGRGYDPNSTDNINRSNSNDPLYQSAGSLTKIYPDINAGLLYYYNAGRNIYAPGIGFYLGLAFSHLNRPNQSIIPIQTSTVPVMIKIHSGFEIHIAKMLNFSPNLLYVSQGSINLVMTGASFTYLLPDHDEYLKPTRIAFGSSYRFVKDGNALIFSVGFGSKSYNLGFSYDLYTESIKSALGFVNNAYELSFKTTFHLSKKAKKSSKFHTPLM